MLSNSSSRYIAIPMDFYLQVSQGSLNDLWAGLEHFLHHQGNNPPPSLRGWQGNQRHCQVVTVPTGSPFDPPERWFEIPPEKTVITNWKQHSIQYGLLLRMTLESKLPYWPEQPSNQEEQQQDLMDIRWPCHHHHLPSAATRTHRHLLPRRMPLQTKLSPTAPWWQDWGALGSPCEGDRIFICVWIPPITGPGIKEAPYKLTQQ